MYMSDAIYPIFLKLQEDELKLHAFFEALHDEFTANPPKGLPKPTIEDISVFLENNYKAYEIKDETFLGLDKDVMVDVKNIVKMYRIDDPEIMEELYTDEEKEEQLEIPDAASDYQYKNRFNIILESEDKVSISGYTLQGTSNRMRSLIWAVCAKITEEDIEAKDPYYLDYLASLWWAGFLKVAL